MHCVDDPGSCPWHDICPTRGLWCEIMRSIQDVLERTTLEDLVKRSIRVRPGSGLRKDGAEELATREKQ